MSERKEQCETCRYYHCEYEPGADGLFEGSDGERWTLYEIDKNGPVGVCRRYPRSPRQSDCDVDLGDYPGVFVTDWCGEWKPADAPEPGG